VGGWVGGWVGGRDGGTEGKTSHVTTTIRIPSYLKYVRILQTFFSDRT
jgi:hypothetical protein